MAKTVYVWLDQLSKKYGRPLTTLDQIPDEELDTLARWGFTGLWLIGIWERSPASRRIKQKVRQSRGRWPPPIPCIAMRSPPTWAGRRPCRT